MRGSRRAPHQECLMARRQPERLCGQHDEPAGDRNLSDIDDSGGGRARQTRVSGSGGEADRLGVGRRRAVLSRAGIPMPWIPEP